MKQYVPEAHRKLLRNRNKMWLDHMSAHAYTGPSPLPQNWGMGKPRWTWDFLRPLGMGLGWVVFQNVPGEIQRHFAREIAGWNVRDTLTLELWPGVVLEVRPRYYPTAAFIISGPVGPAGLEMSRVAIELARQEKNEEARYTRKSEPSG